MKYLTVLLLFISLGLHAQQVETHGVTSVALAKPGVRYQSPGKGLSIDFRSQNNFELENLDGSTQSLNLNTRNFKLKIPLSLKPSFTALFGIHRQEERYRFSNFNPGAETDGFLGSLNNTTLKTNRYSLSLLKPINHKLYAALKSELIFTRNDYDLTEEAGKHTNYRFNAILGFKRSVNTEYGVGLFYGKSFNRTSLYPFAFLNHTFNEKWGLEFIIPVKLKARYNLSKKQLLLFGPEYEGRSHWVEAGNTSPSIFQFSRSSVSFSAAYMHHIGGWVWFQAKAGYSHQMRSRLDDIELNTSYKLKTGSAPFFSIGIFLSPSGKSRR